MSSAGSRLTRFRQRLGREEGFALVVTIGVVMAVGLLAVALMGVAISQSGQASYGKTKTRAIHVAEAGLDAYLYQLKQNPYYYTTNPTVPATSYGGGTYSVLAVAPTTSTALTVYASAWLPLSHVPTTIAAEVRFPTFADYTFLSNTSMNIGVGADITGKVRANGNIRNDGRCRDLVSASGAVTGSGTFDDGYEQGVASVDFAGVTTDLTNMRSWAQADGTYLAPYTGPGYYLQLSSLGRYTVSRVTGGTGTGNLTLQLVGTYNLPARGVVYVDDDVWVDGSFYGRMTVATPGNIYIKQSITHTSGPNPSSLGLIAGQSVIVPTWYANFPNTIDIRAAMLAQTGTVYGDLRSGVVKDRITINGSMSFNTQGYFASVSGGVVVAGFRQRFYSYDTSLDLNPPPQYPVIKDGSMKVSSWREVR